MKTWRLNLMSIILACMCLFISIGYAVVSSNLFIDGMANVTPSLPDIYISNVTPSVSSGVELTGTNGTVLFSEVTGSGTATFTVTVKNISDKIYIFERTIGGAETGVDGAYTGNDITYKVSGISSLDEVAANGGTRSFRVEITVPRNVTAENYILYFKFIEKQGTEILPGNDDYDITFKYNNGQPDSVIKVHSGEFIPRPQTPVRAGYNFIGWYVDTSYTTAWNFDIDRADGAMTLYAGWDLIYTPDDVEPEEYVVIFKPNNGDENIMATVDANSLIPPVTSPTMDGYTFIGWYTDESCTDAWNFDTDKITADMILYGGWEIYVPPVPPDRDITFRPNNGEPDTTIIVLTGEFIPRPQTPVKEGYTFIGWYTDEACSNAWNFDVNKVEGDMILYGGWEETVIDTPVEYTVTFKANNGTSDISVTVELGNLIARPETPVKDGYTFIGWYTDVNCTQGWNFDTDKPTSDMTLYAGWEIMVADDPDDEAHSDFMGLVEALLSDSNSCLNHSDLIFDAVMQSLTSKKRPKEDAPILHCSVNSVSGGTMSAIASYANAKLSANLHFIFEVDPDPAYQDTRMRLYMYYGDECKAAKDGDIIMVYKQIVTRGPDGVWFADGTYIGEAVVGDYFGGGNAGKDVKTINPYTWVSNQKAAH